jgi:hypothetical protein
VCKQQVHLQSCLYSQVYSHVIGGGKQVTRTKRAFVARQCL